MPEPSHPELHGRIHRFAATPPSVSPSAFVAPGAVLVGDVTLESESSVWFQAVLRADLHTIHIGPQSNIQDGAVVHLSDAFGTSVGQRVTVGHGAILHACRVDDEVLVGMNAVVLDGCEIGARSILGANALLTSGTRIPPGSLVLGSPARVVRPLTLEEQSALASWAERYVILARAYREGIPHLVLPPLPPPPSR
ncbi:MAG: hypothetical protein RLZZ244_2596 [Verrucomicrobiota bacterium]|jgi:carbonic anhydrase/acetyltransferase-like protein (isoleucine patch superfamily)